MRLPELSSAFFAARADHFRPGFFLPSTRGRAAALILDDSVAAIRSLVTYLVVLVYIAVAAPLGLVIAVGVPVEAGMYALGHAGSGWR